MNQTKINQTKFSQTQFNHLLMRLVDSTMALIPRQRPSEDCFRGVRIIAHRGAVDDAIEAGFRENTINAFEQAIKNGAWGIEFDLRWTSDEIPVVHHDADCNRVFGKNLHIYRTTFSELRAKIPEIPTFEEVLREFSGRAHFFIEIKKTEKEFSDERINELIRLLSNFQPVRDYHLMSIDLKILEKCSFVPSKALVTIAQWNVSEVSRFSIEKKVGAFTGQYAMIGNQDLRNHLEAGQIVGTGFASSRSVVYREVGRGVKWLYTNQVKKVAQILKARI